MSLESRIEMERVTREYAAQIRRNVNLWECEREGGFNILPEGDPEPANARKVFTAHYLPGGFNLFSRLGR